MPAYYQFTSVYDEQLITNILNKYLSLRLGNEAISQFVILEFWKENARKTRPEDKSLDINDIHSLIIQAVENPQNQNKLIFAPICREDHFTGFVIDVRNKQALYIDPFGRNAIYSEDNQFIKNLKERNIQFDYIRVKQQNDITSCGPLLTASMIKLIEAYLVKNNIFSQGFEASKNILATDRMFQMYVNNGIELPFHLDHPKHGWVTFPDEVILADIDLWGAFLFEQNINNDDIKKEIYRVVNEQKNYINSFKHFHEYYDYENYKIAFIKQFQSKLIELIFLKKENKIPDLIQKHDKLFALPTTAQLNSPEFSIKLSDLFSNENFPETLKVLQIKEAEREKTALSISPLLAIKLHFVLARNKNLAVLGLCLLIASAIGFTLLMALGITLSPWLAIPCALLFLGALAGIKIAYNAYSANKRIRESSHSEDIFDEDKAGDRKFTIDPTITNTSNRPSINQTGSLLTQKEDENKTIKNMDDKNSLPPSSHNKRRFT